MLLAYFLSRRAQSKRTPSPFKGNATANETQQDADVAEEAHLTREGVFEREPAVVVRGLTKRFQSGWFCWRKTFTAVDNVWYSIPNGQLFALLGHNGSGKSTTFNALTGLTNATEGDATIFGHSIRGDFKELHAQMGICPQHDVLWGQLTPREHLRLFAVLKGVPSEEVEAEVEKRIAQVKLQYAADRMVGGFSGGMKRRLSIAIALIGDPAIVFLDEPTTGMDPVTRAEVLEMIAEVSGGASVSFADNTNNPQAKKNRVIVLTSHAMEEVDLLADKVAIMSHGTIQAVGTTLRLKKRFGKGYKMTMFVGSRAAVSRIEDFMKARAPPGTALVADNSAGDGSLHYQLSNATSPSELVEFFRAFEASKESLEVKDYSLALSSLEDVFLNLSQRRDEEDEVDAEAERPISSMAPALVKKSGGETAGTLAQLRALGIKSLRFQWRMRRSNFYVTFLPVFILVAILILDRVVFYPLRLDAVCGSGVSAGNCLTAGYDLECAARAYEYRPIDEANSFDVGIIQQSGANRRGRGINPNCDEVRCYDGLEKMEPRLIPVSMSTSPSFFGNASYVYDTPNASALLQDWYANLLFELSNDTCTTLLDDALSANTTLLAASAYLAVQNQTVAASALGSLDYCLKDPGASSRGGLRQPAPETLLVLARLQDEVIECQEEHLTVDVINGLFTSARAGIALASVLAPNATRREVPPLGSSNGTKFLSYLSLDRYADPELNDFISVLGQLIDSTFGPLAFQNNVTAYQEARGAWAAARGLSPFVTPAVPTMQDLCVSPFSDALLLLFNSSTELFENFCAFALYTDAARGTSTIDAASSRLENTLPASFDRYVYSRWYGREVSTPLMRSANLTLKQVYRRRQFYSLATAVDFQELSGSAARYLVYFNRTATQDNDTGNWPTILKMVDDALVRGWLDGARGVSPRFTEMARAFDCNRDAWLNGTAGTLTCDLLPQFLQLSIIDFVAAQLFPFLFSFHMFLIVNTVVYEKEHRLRAVMKMNGGLKNGVYWAVYYAFYFVQFMLMCLLMYLIGNAAGLRFTSLHEPAVFWVFAFSWGNLLVAFSFLMSVFFSSTTASTAFVLLFILIFNIVGIELIGQILQDPASSDANYAPFMWVPNFLMIRYVVWMGAAGGLNQKIYYGSLTTFADGAIGNTIGIMWIEWAICLVLVWYLDNTWVAGFGVRKGWLFFLDRTYWGCAKREDAIHVDDIGTEASLRRVANPPGIELPSLSLPDVAAEYERVVSVESASRGVDEGKQGNSITMGSSDNEAGAPSPSNDIAVRIVRLHKSFGEGAVAVKSVSLGINDCECFGLLGHNGAGKTTLLNMLVGLFPPTSGTALASSAMKVTNDSRLTGDTKQVRGLSILKDMSIVQTEMGICPQHDVVWGPLSVRDHLNFYGRLKGVKERDLRANVDAALRDVNLKRFEYRTAKALSGGMRRRLSVAMSLIGSPKVVYLDEPSTGLDPASKRALWNVIKRAKGNKSLVLTTHSMEEAEVLCDRIGIMALGELQCIGTAAQLKQRFGAGYTFYISSSLHRDDPATSEVVLSRFATSLFPTAKPLGRVFGGSAKFEVRREEVVLSDVFQRMNEESTVREIGLVDWSLTETTLEEVFLKLAELAEVDTKISSPASPSSKSGLPSFPWFHNKSSRDGPTHVSGTTETKNATPPEGEVTVVDEEAPIPPSSAAESTTALNLQ